MKSPQLICRNRSSLLIIDIQQKLVPVISNRERVVQRAKRLLQAATLFGIPVTVSEQYPQGLGPTASELELSRFPEIVKLEKTTFSCREGVERFNALKLAQRDQVIVCGMESHICVLQSSLDLAAQGFQVFVAVDAIGSRDPQNTNLAIDRCAQANIPAVSSESILFEWCETAEDPNFKAISRMVK